LRRFNQKTEEAERQFNRKIKAATPPRDPFGIDPIGTWRYRETIERTTKEAALTFLREILFLVLNEYYSQEPHPDELRNQVNAALVYLRQQTFQFKWPKPMPTSPEWWEEQRERDFDRALISSLESREEWRNYEARILPQIAVPTTVCGSHPGAPNPLLYFPASTVEGLTRDATRRIGSGLLEIHGAFLDREFRESIECWHRAYDLVAGEFDNAGMLSEELLSGTITEIVADAAAGGAWFSEPLGQVRPTGIFNLRLGSQFYPLWRYQALVESLVGRIAHWRGRVLLHSSHLTPQEPRRGRRPLTEEHKSLASLVAALGPDWKCGANLQRLAEWMDSAPIRVEARSRKAGIETWVEKLVVSQANFIKAIEYRLRQAKK
jgi:hypothetical protein